MTRSVEYRKQVVQERVNAIAELGLFTLVTPTSQVTHAKQPVTLKCVSCGSKVTCSLKDAVRCGATPKSRCACQRKEQAFTMYDAAAASGLMKIKTPRPRVKNQWSLIEYKCLSCYGVFRTKLRDAAKLKFGCHGCANRANNDRIRRKATADERAEVFRVRHPDLIIHGVRQTWERMGGGEGNRNRYIVDFDCPECGFRTEKHINNFEKHQQCAGCATKLHSGFTVSGRHEFYEVNGTRMRMQGYEDIVVQHLLDVGVPERLFDKVTYVDFFEYVDGRTVRKYIPDFKCGNYVCEVKSMGTLGVRGKSLNHRTIRNVKRKARGVVAAGSRFRLILCEADRRRGWYQAFIMPDEWLEWKPSQIKSYIQERFANDERLSLDIRLPRL